MEIYVGTLPEVKLNDISPETIDRGLMMLDGTSCSEISITHDDKWLYIVSNGTRARVQYTAANQLIYLQDGNKIEDKVFVQLMNGEAELIPYQDTISMEKTRQVCHFFITNNGKLLDEFV